jgi:hypothetical protein
LVVVVIAIVALLVGVVGGVSLIGYLLPDAKVENVEITSDTRIINGEFDYGELVSFDLKSTKSDAKDVPVRVTLTCSEGKWVQEQTVHLGPEESKHLSFFFAEPTINVTGVKARVEVVPKLK